MNRRLTTLLGFGLWLFGTACAAGTATLTYDALQRLTLVDYGNGTTLTYNYDATGNRFSVVTVGGAALGVPTGINATNNNGQLVVAFAPPAPGSGSPITSYTATASPGGVSASCVAPCSAITFTGLTLGTPYAFSVTANNGAGSSAASATSNSVAPAVVSYTAPNPVSPASGNLTATLSGGGAGCGFSGPVYLPLTGHPQSPPAGSAPTYVEFPDGLFRFSTVGCSNGSALTVAITYPETLPTGLQYWKYGPTPGNGTPHWYVQPATVAGHTLTLPLTDGASGDDDLVSNGVVSSLGGWGFAPWDVFWRRTDGVNAIWQFTGPGPTQLTTAFPPGVALPWQAKLTGDINGDGIPDVVWFEPTNGLVAIWLMSSPTTVTSTTYPGNVGGGSPWTLTGLGDVNGDGRADLVWRHSTTGEVLAWLMSATGTITTTVSFGTAPLSYELRGIGDTNGDGIADLVWFQPSDGQVAVWLLAANGTHTAGYPSGVGVNNWRPLRVGDFDGDGKADIFWRDQVSGATSVWYLNGTVLAATQACAAVSPTTWQSGPVVDFDLDGRKDLLWFDAATGSVVRWLMQGRGVAPLSQPLTGIGTTWQVTP